MSYNLSSLIRLGQNIQASSTRIFDLWSGDRVCRRLSLNRPDFPNDGISKPDTETDDSHGRWGNASDSDKAVWDYYNNVVARQIVQLALKSPSLTLADLFLALSSARLKCEWVKSKKPKNQEEILYYSTCEIDSDYNPRGFGRFQPGGNEEREIYDGWGNQVSTLVKERLGDLATYNRMIALSYIDFDCSSRNTSLKHPSGTVLDRLNPNFKSLVCTDNIFEFLSISSTLIYEISNYPPISRGSAAVSTQMIDNIFMERFGSKITPSSNMSIRPLLYDWTSFFEMPSQYTLFYAISAAAKIISSLPGLTEEQNNYITTTLPELMRADPTFNIKKREEEAWQNLRSFIAGMLGNPSLSDDQRKYLGQLQEGHFESVEPSPLILKLYNYIISTDEDDITMENIKSSIGDNDITTTLTTLENLFFLEKRIREDHPKLFNDDIYKKNLQDVSLLRKIPMSKRKRLENCFFTHPPHEATKPEPRELDPPRLSDNVENGRSEINELLSHNNKINRLVPIALLSGGITVEYMKTLSIDQIQALTSRAAILLYNANIYSRAADFVDNNVDVIENNILKQIAKHFCNEPDFRPIEDPGIRKLLLSVSELYQTGSVTISSLVGQTLTSTEDKVFQALLEEYSKSMATTSTLPESYATAVFDCILQLAEDNNREDIIIKALEKIPDINSTNSNGLTPLHKASIKGQHKVVKALLDKNADIYRQNPAGESALDIAAQYGHLEVVKAFLNKGITARINSVNCNGLTPLMIAAERGYSEIVRALLDIGADINKTTPIGDTALHLAARNNYLEVIQLLLGRGANFNSVDNDGNTPLHTAVYWGSPEVVRALLNEGADFSKPNHVGKTPWDLAARNPNSEIATIMKAHHETKSTKITGKEGEAGEVHKTARKSSASFLAEQHWGKGCALSEKKPKPEEELKNPSSNNSDYLNLN